MDASSNEDRHPLESNYPCFLSTRRMAQRSCEAQVMWRGNVIWKQKLLPLSNAAERDGKMEERVTEWFFLYNQ